MLHWSTAGDLPPLLITPTATRNTCTPNLPFGVNTELHCPDHTHPLPAGAALVFCTDELVEHPAYAIDHGLNALAHLATTHATLPLEELVETLADHHSSDGHDDMAILVLRTPPGR